MEEPIAAMSTYIPPGISFSCEPFGGAREATVEVKDFSRLNAPVRRLLVLSSAEAAYLWRKRREFAICWVRRSVGLGDVVVGVVEGALGAGVAGAVTGVCVASS
jgi:hypothetical protein